MTTIAVNLREIAADTRVTQEGVGTDAYSGIKLYPAKSGAIYGATGANCTGQVRALEWLMGDRALELKPHPPEYEHDWDWLIIELSRKGIATYNEYLEREPALDGMLAVGSGRKVALYCMKHLHMSPAAAVREACRMDDFSDLPIYVASLERPKPVRWSPPKRRKQPPPSKVPA